MQWEERGVGRGSLLYANDRLYCYGEKGKLALLEANPTAYVEHGTIDIEPGEGPHWAHPSLSNGILYIRHGDALLAFNVAAVEKTTP